jgi:hypothetical protein
VEFDDPVATVFEFWKSVMGHERAQLGPKRRRAVESALEWGYKVDDLRLAVLGCRNSPRNMGQNEERAVYDDLELIVRDESHIDRFSRLGEQAVRTMIAKDRELEAADSEKRVPMPPEIRAKLDALLRKKS